MDYFVAFHILGDSPSFIVLLATIFPFTSRQDAFYYQFSLGFGLFIRCLMKLIFRDPRPFMTTLSVYPNLCDLSYGTPDSEIFLATLMIGVVYLNKNRQENCATQSTFARKMNSFAWFLAIYFWLNLLFCGFVNGLCTID